VAVNSVLVEKSEARTIAKFTGIALERLQKESDPSLLLELVNVWSLAGIESDRRFIGKQMLNLLNRKKVRNPVIAREVLRYVGTPVCACPVSDAWKAVTTFLESSHLLSVNLEALGAAVRLSESGEVTTDRSILKKCRADAMRLSESRCPEAVDLARELVGRLA